MLAILLLMLPLCCSVADGLGHIIFKHEVSHVVRTQTYLHTITIHRTVVPLLMLFCLLHYIPPISSFLICSCHFSSHYMTSEQQMGQTKTAMRNTDEPLPRLVELPAYDRTVGSFSSHWRKCCATAASTTLLAGLRLRGRLHAKDPTCGAFRYCE